MAGANSHQELVVKKFETPQSLKTISVACLVIGLIGFGVGLFRDPERAWAAYLTAFFFVSCLGLSGLIIPVLNHIAKAGASSGIRRLVEGFSSFIPVMTVGALALVIFGAHHLFSWTHKEVIEASALVAAKVAYLNIPGLFVRVAIFCGGVWIFNRIINGNSVKQDATGNHELTKKNLAFSVGCILFFAISFTLFSMDLLMTLLPTWYSTIFGVYTFAGLLQSGFALFIIVAIFMKRQGFVKGYYSIEHIHDLAKFLKGFTIFWAYIAFSQFMLIWYANIPEETEYYLMRSSGGWLVLSFALLVFKFAIPFLALLPRAAKRSESHLILVCSLILIMQYLDVYWMVYPNFNENHFTFGFYEIALLAGFVGLLILTTTKFYEKNSLVAVKDPRLHESLNHHVTY
jgi:hypothetical protein